MNLVKGKKPWLLHCGPLHTTGTLRRRKKRASEILQASDASVCKQKACMASVADGMERDREDRRKWRKTQKSQQEKERASQAANTNAAYSG